MQIPFKSIELTQVVEWTDGDVGLIQDYLVAEEPLEIRMNGQPLTVTMRTPGHDLELACGFLLSEGVIAELDQIASMESVIDAESGAANVVQVVLGDIHFEGEKFRRHFTTASSCGICGRASIETIRRRNLPRPSEAFRVDPEVLCGLPEKLRVSQAIFSRTGGLHAAALFSSRGEVIVLREDIGRHNAVDKILGWALFEGRVPLSDTVLLVSGRGGFEIIQKALAAGIPMVASVSAPSSLAVQLARELGLTLIGFLRGRRFVIYSGSSRCILQKLPES